MTKFATLTVVQALLRLLGEDQVSDIRRWKDAFIKEREAEATAKDADAQRRIAEATTAANLAT